MTNLFGWCLPRDDHHYNDGSPGECPGKSQGGLTCACPCHTDADWQPEPPRMRKRPPRIITEDEDEPTDDEPDAGPDVEPAEESAPVMI